MLAYCTKKEKTEQFGVLNAGLSLNSDALCLITSSKLRSEAAYKFSGKEVKSTDISKCLTGEIRCE